MAEMIKNEAISGLSRNPAMDHQDCENEPSEDVRALNIYARIVLVLINIGVIDYFYAFARDSSRKLLCWRELCWT